MIKVAKQKLEAAEESLKKYHYSVAAQDAIDAIEFALKYPLRLFGVKYEEKISKEKSRKLHDVRQYYLPDVVEKISSILPYPSDYSYEQLCKIVFYNTIWLQVKDTIKYGLEEHPIKFSSPDKLIEKELAEIIIKHAKEVVSLIETFDSSYQNIPFEKAKKKFGTNRKNRRIKSNRK